MSYSISGTYGPETLLDTANGVTKIFPFTVGATQFTINTNVTPTTSCSIGYMVDCEL